jgi:hypothetical protein
MEDLKHSNILCGLKILSVPIYMLFYQNGEVEEEKQKICALGTFSLVNNNSWHSCALEVKLG